MIEGLKVTIKGTELQKLCRERAAYHEGRVTIYMKQLSDMDRAEIESTNLSGGDPKRALKDKQNDHECQISELRFIADHLIATEEYLLDREDLEKIGIVKRRIW